MRLSLAVAMVLALVCGSAYCGPFGRSVSRSSATYCTGSQCAKARTVVRGSGAQAHAEAMASSGRMYHAPTNGFYEGVGTGSTPQSALRSCCNNGGAVIEEGVAYGNGRWYACRRYTTR